MASLSRWNRTRWCAMVAAGALILTMGWGGMARAAEPVLKKGARLAIAGDSITQQKLYSAYIETYLLACRPDLDVRVMQLGWGGETAPGFLARMDYDLLSWKPDVVTTCYGMNDGGYRAYSNTIGETYFKAMSNIVAQIKAAGGTVVVGSPGVVDSFTYKRGNTNNLATVYNDNLAQLGELDRKLAADNGFPFADVHGTMMTVMVAAKAARSNEYAVAGRDGVHPGENGHLLMASAFLKALGMDGDVGTITLKWNGSATATIGHEILSVSNGVVELESSRYPFCFPAASTNGDGVASILPFASFQHDFNRLTLVVKGLPGDRAEVKWGPSAKVFTKAQLEAGVNLAAEFLDNPFSAPFEQVMTAVKNKQAFETRMIKRQFRGQRDAIGKDAAQAEAMTKQRDALLADHATQTEAARAMVKPVRHQIQILTLPAGR